MASGYNPYDPQPSRSLGHFVVGVAIAVLVAGAVIIALSVASRKAKVNQPQARQSPAVKMRAGVPDIDDPNFEAWAAREAAKEKAYLVLIWFLIIGWILTCIFSAVWIIKDTRNRSVDSGILWALVLFWFGLIGLLVYLASRPSGSLVTCHHCGNKRLEFVTVCPHCHVQTGQPMRVNSLI